MRQLGQILVTIQIPVGAVNIDAVVQTVASTLEPTRVETGCLTYYCSRCVEDPNALLIVQRWATEDDFQAHVRSKTFRVLLEALESSSRAPEFAIHHVSSTAGLDGLQRFQDESPVEQRTP